MDGEAFTADAVHLADYDQIVQEPGGATITEAGYLPVTGFSLGGEPVAVAALNDPGGGGWGAHVRITGTGTATVSPSGAPGAVYDQLSYEIVGFNGLATYGFDDDGAVVGGAISDPVTLVAGSLISGGAEFVPSEAGLTIEGSVSLTVDEVAPGFATGGRLDTFTVAYVHPPEDNSFVSPTTTRVAATSGTSGAFTAAEPEDSAVFEEPVDWDAIAARVSQNFAETGQWYF